MVGVWKVGQGRSIGPANYGGWRKAELGTMRNLQNFGLLVSLFMLVKHVLC